MPLTSHQNHLFSPRENIPFPGSEFWIQARATRVAHLVKEKRMFFVLALPGRTGTGPPAPLLSHSTHVTSLFHADIRLVRTEDEMVEHRDADEVACFM